MKKINVSVTYLIDKRRQLKDQTYPIKMTVYYGGSKKRYATGLTINDNNWEKLSKGNLRDDDLKLLKRKLSIQKEKAESIIERMEEFSFDEFENQFYNDKKVSLSSDLRGLFNEYIDELNAKGRVGSASIYNTTINSLLKFKSKIRVQEVTRDFLEAFEKHLTANNISETTVGIYMRHLRAIINIAINKGILKADKYPFKGYTIPSSRNIKKALQKQHIKQILAYNSSNPDTQKAIDFWIFSYISNGMNFTDICNLKTADIKGVFFSFHRAKTINTKKRDKRPIKVPLISITKAIIERWRTKDNNTPYLFPILKPGLTPIQQKYKIQDFIWKVNKHMNSIAAEIGFEGKIDTYSARHTHSTILKRSGVSSDYIKENLGHASVVTTENYLDDFEDDIKLEYAKKLIDL